MKKYYFEFITNLFNFNGSTSRSGFWWPTITNLILYFIIVAFSSLLFKVSMVDLVTINTNSTGLYILMSLVTIVFAVFSLALLCRRLHDTNHSGWLIFFTCLPFYVGYIVGIYVFILTLMPSVNSRWK